MKNTAQNRLTKILAFIAVIWLLIALAAPSFLAPEIEKQTRTFFKSADIDRLRDKGIELSLENYRRSYFSSSADIRLSIRPFSGQPTWYSTTLHARINHAPLVNSGLNLFSASLTNSETDGSLAAYIPDGHLHIKAGLAALGQLHQTIRIEKNETPNLSSEGISLSWHSHIRHPDQGNGEWLLGTQQWQKNGTRLDIARSGGTYRSDGDTLRLNAAQLNLGYTNAAQQQQDIVLYNLQGNLTREERRYTVEDLTIKSKNAAGVTQTQRLQQTLITAFRRDNGSLRNLEAQGTVTSDLPLLKAFSGDRLYLSLQQESDGNRLILTSNKDQATHLSGSLLFPLLFPPPYSTAQLNGTRGEFLLYGDYAKQSGLLPVLALALGNDRLRADTGGNYPLQVDINGNEIRVNGKTVALLH
ncbi:hypothetical protein [uncultured Cardiobacterium sp.]|uniref:hypothetical protein n=1 Tax=uncultured Cardiobacterium sp. TaxID=417619 RepID=UPI002618455E|nr:hypothetical protein [uncultured Cardiobacterium sp.]